MRLTQTYNTEAHKHTQHVTKRYTDVQKHLTRRHTDSRMSHRLRQIPRPKGTHTQTHVDSQRNTQTHTRACTTPNTTQVQPATITNSDHNTAIHA